MIRSCPGALRAGNFLIRQKISLGEIDFIGGDIGRGEEINSLTWLKCSGFGKMSWWGLNVLAKCSEKIRDFSLSVDASILLLSRRGGMISRILVNFFVALHKELGVGSKELI